MSFQDDLKLAMALELGVAVDDITGVAVRWDNGDRYDPTYPGENAAPTFEVDVTVRSVHGKYDRRTLSAEFTLTALLRAVLGVGDGNS